MKQFFILLGSLYLLVAGGIAQEYPRMGPDIFDPRADGEDLIARALAQAAPLNKEVLVIFGANWCPWTRRLHKVLSEDKAVAEILQRAFVPVYVDANTRNDKKRNAAVIARYGDPVRLGIPVFVVLDHDGRRLTTRETQSLAAPADDEVAARFLRFLREWASATANPAAQGSLAPTVSAQLQFQAEVPGRQVEACAFNR